MTDAYAAALQLHGAGRLEQAEAAYRAALAQTPANAPQRPEMLRNYGFLLHQRHRFREAIAALDEAVKGLPGDVNAWSALGQCAREIGDHGKAMAAFQAAAKLAPEREDVLAAVSGYLSRAIPAWHLPMLADAARNAAYEQAIAKAAGGSALTLDIGTGSGLLAMLAARHGARRVVACEAHPIIADTATEIVARNGLQGRIRVVAKRSTEMRPEIDMENAKADLIVSEILDAGLLGEGVLATLRDALARLAAPGAKVIPGKADVYVQAIALPGLRAAYPLREICGFDLSPFDRFRNRAGHATQRLDHLDYQPLSAPLPVARIDFANPPDWSQPKLDRIALPITAGGNLHAFALWFDLWLDAETRVTTAPTREANGAPGMPHWGQAILWQMQDRTVRQGETLPLIRELADTYIDIRQA